MSKNSPVRDGVSFTEIVRSSPPQENTQPLQSKITKGQTSSLKRHGSSESVEVCKHCLRPGHKIDVQASTDIQPMLRHGHFTARFPLKSPYSDPKKERARLKKPQPPALTTPKSLLHVPASRPSFAFPSLGVSLPITEDIIQPNEELKKLMIIKVLYGNASVHSLHAALLLQLNFDQCKNLTPFKMTSFSPFHHQERPQQQSRRTR